MKMSQSKKIAMIMVLIFMVPYLWNQSTVVAYAASPTFADSKVEIVGEGEVYQLEIKNEVAGSTYKWSSSNSDVAKISGRGLVTAVNKGTSTIKCKIVYSSGKSKTISCKVTVVIPATDLKINNAVEKNGAHILLIGEKFNFNRDLTPSNSSDKTYWSIGGGDSACIEIDSSSSGIVTAKKAGKVILVATAAPKSTEDEAKKSIVHDAIIIEVVGPTATVHSAEIVSTTEIKVEFDSQIQKSTVIGTNNKLLDSIEITARKDTKGVQAKDPETLTASLSSDLKTLTITTSNSFEGEYGINFTSNIKTTEELAIEEYYTTLSYVDTNTPEILKTDVDDTGMVTTITFTEEIDFTNFQVKNAKTINSSQITDVGTISFLNNELNYIISNDKKSISINLDSIATTDYDKIFYVTISGIKDMSGNSPENAYLVAYIRTDTTQKAQARPMTVVRTSYDTITATFSRALREPGYATINGSYIDGVINPDNNKQVNYTLTDYEASLSGVQTIEIGYWDSYNVKETDTYADRMRKYSVSFISDKTSPVLISYEFDAETSVLSMIYNEEVSLNETSGYLSYVFETKADEIRTGMLTYTEMVSEEDREVKILLGNISLVGNYTFTLEQGFAIDNYKNLSVGKTIAVSNSDGISGELIAPYLITQSTTDLSQIYVEFANKLDLVSAQTVSNYNITGVTVTSAQVINNTPENGATVLLTVANGSIDVTVDRPVTISGIRGYNGTYSEMSPYTTSIELKDNLKPQYSGAVFDKSAMNRVRLNFNEEIQGSLIVRVTVLSTGIELGNTVEVSGNSVYIELDTFPADKNYLKIEILDNSITDLSGNKAILQTTVGVLVSY